MKAAGEVARAEHSYCGKKQIRTVALRDADLSAFTADEIALVDAIISECWGTNATQISNMSHRFRGWSLAEDGETIPYEVALIQFRPPSDADRQLDAPLVSELRSLAKECLSDGE